MNVTYLEKLNRLPKQVSKRPGSINSRLNARQHAALVFGCVLWVFSNQSCSAHEQQTPFETFKIPIKQIKHNGYKSSAPRKLQHTLWWQVANHNRLDPYILYSVALVESAKGNGIHQLTPWPWALNKSGKSFIPASRHAAKIILNQTIASGSRNIDVGLMQVNVRWQGHRVQQPDQLLNPVTNLRVGANVLAEAIQSTPNNLALGIGRYHSWLNKDAALAYGRKVLAVADQIRTVL
jgi:hypothetical protein